MVRINGPPCEIENYELTLNSSQRRSPLNSGQITGREGMKPRLIIFFLVLRQKY
jgi:hypothetical protein